MNELSKTSAMSTKERKIQLLSQICESLSGLYKNSKEKDKEAIDVMIGAQIFYVGSRGEDYNKISEAAYEKYLSMINSGEKRAKALLSLTKEHQIPRKIGGRRLMTLLIENPEIDKKVFEQYVTDLLKWNYVTKEENIRLKEYQKIGRFTTPEESYEKASITLLDMKF